MADVDFEGRIHANVKTAIGGAPPEEGQLTFGQRAVGLTFNPSGDPQVLRIKTHFAQVIDGCHNAREATNNQDEKRMWSLAITHAQEAQMWAVQAYTWGTHT